MHVLLTGMSGTGKSAVVAELRRRGVNAVDADDDGYAEPAADGVWRWRIREVEQLLAGAGDDPLFFAGCSDEQTQVHWDLKLLLTAPKAIILERLATRTTNPFGESAGERERVLADLRDVEPLLRRLADLVIDTTEPLGRVVDRVLLAASEAEPRL